MQKKFMDIALKMAQKAYKKGEIPVGCVIVLNNKIISKSYNTKEKNKDVTCHAEINAIKMACKKLKTWHLDKCELYTTLEPCMMCTGAILQARIKKIYLAAKNDNFGELLNILKNKKNNIEIISGIDEEKSLMLLKNFFKKRRN